MKPRPLEINSDLVYEMLKKNGITQEELGSLIGVSRSYISKALINRKMDLRDVKSVCRELNINEKDLVLTNEKTTETNGKKDEHNDEIIKALNELLRLNKEILSYIVTFGNIHESQNDEIIFNQKEILNLLK